LINSEKTELIGNTNFGKLIWVINASFVVIDLEADVTALLAHLHITIPITRNIP
jgi:hypothetical protein